MNAIVNLPVLPLYKREKACEVIEDELLYGMPVTILEDNGLVSDRVRIRTFYRYEGYVSRKYLWQGEYSKNDQRKLLFTCHPVVDILSEPRVQGILLLTLPMGCFLRQLASEDENGWIKVSLLDGKIGYVKKAYVMPYPQKMLKKETVLRQNIITMAKKYLGTQYRWGGKSTYGIDCSGLCSMAYLLNGVIIFRDSRIESGFPMHEVPFEKIRPGDLLFFKGHVAMWLGENKIIHSTGKNGREGVVIDSIDKRDPHARVDLWDIYQMSGSIF